MRPHVEMALTRAAFTAALPIEAQSARLAYRPMQATDIDALHGIVSHWDVVRQLASFPWPADRAFTATRALPYTGHGFVWGVLRHGDLIGTMAVTGHELGYSFRPDTWGQGYATEACRVALARAFADGRDHVEAGVWADNAASLHLLAKLGFRVTGQDRTFNKARGCEVDGHLLRLDRGDFA